MIIRAPRLTEDLARLQQMILDRKMTTLRPFIDHSEYCKCVYRNSLFETVVKRSVEHTRGGCLQGATKAL